MSQLSWTEIRQNAIAFAHDWADGQRERAEAQTFWNEFFKVFGLNRKLVATFEEPVRSLKNTHHRIDLFWRGKLLAEHKSAGADLGKAESQAYQYVQELAAAGRTHEIPRFLVITDFRRIVLHDLDPEEGEPGVAVDFALDDFHANVKAFAFMIGHKTMRFGEEDPANLEAAKIMAQLHDAVKQGNYDRAFLERFLVRMLFCLFADDTGIFEKGQFELYVVNRTNEDGSDLGSRLRDLFEVLDTPRVRRSAHLDEDLAAFPYIDGELFKGLLPMAGFDRDMRNSLLAALRFDWSRISPALFGSLFQGIMTPAERRKIGAHYTSERDILKVIRPLFLDALRAEFDGIAAGKQRNVRDEKLRNFQEKLRRLKFLDPACGCGNFLVIAYRELRRLEIEALKLLYDFGRRGREIDIIDLRELAKVNVDQFYGIEIEEWPARIAETALWLTDHQMNLELSKTAGHLYQRIPLASSPHIRCGNALRIDWNDLLPARECSYVLGNPPFVGKQFQSSGQKDDLWRVHCRAPGTGALDYVTCWYMQAGRYIGAHPARCAFVSTNSIAQGEQAAILWRGLDAMGLKIDFAHRTFAWQSEAQGKAHVHVVIIGFSKHPGPEPRLYSYEDPEGEPIERTVPRISPYLDDASFAVLKSRTSPIVPGIPPMIFGSMPNDGGHLLLDDPERRALTRSEPDLKPFVRRFMGSFEFINGTTRFCLWLADAPPALVKDSPEIQRRMKLVRQVRLASNRETTRQLAATPFLFGENRQPDCRYLIVPEVSSERRIYIPMAFVPRTTICSNLAKMVPGATPYHFGVLTSAMHMAWVRQVCGRLESRYRYSAKLVYNNFPWPVHASEAQRAKVAGLAERVLSARQGYLDRGNTLADLYDPLTMPLVLVKAHRALDRAVDQCYRKASFASDRERVEFLFRLYDELTSPLAPAQAGARKKKGR